MTPSAPGREMYRAGSQTGLESKRGASQAVPVMTVSEHIGIEAMRGSSERVTTVMAGRIHRLSGTDELADTRTSCKIIANVLSVRRRISVPGFAMRRVTEKVRSGNPTLLELSEWYGHAVRLAREGQV